LLRQRVWFLVALLCATALLYLSNVFWRTDLAIFDSALASAPAPSDVVIVAVDDASIAALGRWPWSRAVHAALLDRLRAQGARAVALDILFTEPDPNSPEGDVALARAMGQDLPTVLPLLPDFRGDDRIPREQLPIAILAQAAAGLGHVDLEVDPDGIVRSVFLLEGAGTATREYLTVALLEHTPGGRQLQLRGDRRPEAAGSSAAWVRDYRVLIPFLGPPGHFSQVSYVDVLNGKVSPSAIRGKWVLVGVTAQGLGDGFATPRSAYSRPMPGVEVGANILQAVRGGTTIQRLSMPLMILLGLIPVALVGVGLQRLAPGRSLLLTASLVIATFSLSVLLLRVCGWWWPPTASLAVLLSAYPLWSWQRLEATQSFLEDELRQLARESFPLLPDLPATSSSTSSDDFLQRRIELLRQATQRLRAAQSEREDVLRFLSHDMKSPATSLLGLAQLQRDPSRALAPHELSQRLDLLAQRVLTLVDSFVALARAESADPANFDHFDLRDAVQDAYDEVWAAAQAREIVISPTVFEEPCMVSGDRQLLARAIINLLSNAIKFSAPGTGVELVCEHVGANAVVSIVDHGPGVAPERRAALFLRFSRGVHRGTDPGGAGLGLAFVRVVAEKHGGAAWAEHEREHGTVFRLSLPLVSGDLA
jgi:CHASE2 domain-containing sensor protein/two-component sensor histidine kinase